MTLRYTVSPSDYFANLKELLKVQFQISDRLLLKLKKSSKLYINGQISPVYAKVQSGDIICVSIDFEEDNSNIPPRKMNLNILYEDDALLVINKPTGMPVHPSMDHYEDSLSNGVKHYFDSIKLYKKIRPVNRLDKDTSGIVIFAKNEYVQECLIRQMKCDIFKKEYIAICDGILDQKHGSITFPIARKENSIIERCIDMQNGVSSITHYEVLQEVKEKNASYSIVKCILETGRTHQIRVHMQAIGHPLLGDTLYGTSSPLIARQALHAYQVKFVHPITKQEVSFIAPLPCDMKNLASMLELADRHV